MLSVLLFKKNTKVLEKILCRCIVSSAVPLRIQRALVLSKMTKYEVENYYNPHLTESELEKMIRQRGSDFDSLKEHHQRHKAYEQYLLQAFKDKGIKTKLRNRLDYSDSSLESCDAVFPVGGDGTFLLAASRVPDNTIPVIGFNSDPLHSEGFLCLPKKYSNQVEVVLQQLQEGSFGWMFRTRIRATLTRTDNEPPVEIHDNKIPGSPRVESALHGKQVRGRRLPALALNEVFVGESMSAQVSYFEMRVLPSGETTKVKSSGLCVSTGTGSTSWHLSMNRITSTGVAQVLACAGLPVTTDCEAIAKKYNDSLLSDPESSMMSYTIRDLISAGVWPSPPGIAACGTAQAIWIRSHCHDARLVIDGGTAYTFNDGAEALFELHAEDALRTIVL